MDGEIRPVNDWESEEFGIEPVKFWFKKEVQIFGFQIKIEIVK